MGTFLFREISYNNIQQELMSIGFDAAYLNTISEKFRNKNVKIYGLTVAQANILKQTALIFGADCAVNRNVITGNIELSDVILCGSYSQLKKIAAKLKGQPFKLAMLSSELINFLEPIERKTKLAGVLNITPDSFSDGGLYYNPDDARRQFDKLIIDGADIIDIGAESTRPFSEPVEPQEQIRRLKPILQNVLDITVSVDTRSSEVADFALNNGAKIINDVSGFEFDSKMIDVIARYNAEVVIQHSKGGAEDFPVYDNVVEEVYSILKNKAQRAQQAGIRKVIIDPGIGFGKTREDNFRLLDNIKTFYSLDCPVMVGISRKRLLGAENAENDIKDALTLVYSYPLIKAGVDYLRVHNVKLHKTLLNSMPD